MLATRNDSTVLLQQQSTAYYSSIGGIVGGQSAFPPSDVIRESITVMAIAEGEAKRTLLRSAAADAQSHCVIVVFGIRGGRTRNRARGGFSTSRGRMQNTDTPILMTFESMLTNSDPYTSWLTNENVLKDITPELKLDWKRWMGEVMVSVREMKENMLVDLQIQQLTMEVLIRAATYIDKMETCNYYIVVQIKVHCIGREYKSNNGWLLVSHLSPFYVSSSHLCSLGLPPY
eukprot:g577.t1 g577   contig10:322776-323468(-)